MICQNESVFIAARDLNYFFGYASNEGYSINNVLKIDTHSKLTFTVFTEDIKFTRLRDNS